MYNRNVYVETFSKRFKEASDIDATLVVLLDEGYAPDVKDVIRECADAEKDVRENGIVGAGTEYYGWKCADFVNEIERLRAELIAFKDSASKQLEKETDNGKTDTENNKAPVVASPSPRPSRRGRRNG